MKSLSLELPPAGEVDDEEFHPTNFVAQTAIDDVSSGVSWLRNSNEFVI